MAFLKKLTNSEKRVMAANAGWRENEALKRTYCVTSSKPSKGHDVITLHYWHTDNDGNNVRRRADYDRKTHRWV